MDRKRDELIVKVDVDREVTWDEVNRKSRIPKGDASTAVKRMKEVFGIKRRTPRFKPARLLKHRQSIRERLYGSFYMGASIWELLYGSFYMRACTVRYQCVTNALLVRYSVRYPSALPPFSLVLQ